MMMQRTAKWYGFFVAACVLLSGCISFPTDKTRTPELGAPRTGAEGPGLPARPGYAPAAPGMPTPQQSVKVALLVPLSGKNASLGAAMQDAAVLAIFDKYEHVPKSKQGAKVELLPKDTGDTPESARLAAQQAVDEGASIILGPLLGHQVPPVAEVARDKNIPVVSFSNNPAVLSEGVYLFGFMPDQQVKRVIEYALARGVKQIAGIAPSNPYGNTVMKQLSQQADAAGARAQPIEYYPENSTTLVANVGRIASVIKAYPAGSIALLIAEGGPRLPVINDALNLQKIQASQIPLFGTGLWDSGEVMKYPALQGAMFASAEPAKYGQFVSRFSDRFGYVPDRRASLAYDAMALAATLALQPDGANFSKDAIIDPVGFNGPANGIFRFKHNGMSERALAVLQVTPNGFITLEPAPDTFLR